MTSAKGTSRSALRTISGLVFLVLAAAIWIPQDDVVDLIVRNHPVLLGRYSPGHLGLLIVLSVLLTGLSALSFSRLASVREMIQTGVLVLLSTGVSGFVLVVGSGLAAQPRYVETVATMEEDGRSVQGLVRRRPPNEHYELVQDDVPEQKRSYPDLPPGYPSYSLTLTTDTNGFRNTNVQEHYPLLAVGDSFVAGSNVSDEQVWTQLLSSRLQTTIYNLGVPGTDPGEYLNNFVVSGRKFKPSLVLFMIYEGNDFKDVTAPVVDLAEPSLETAAATPTGNEANVQDDSLGRRMGLWAKASPVTRGWHRLSTDVLENIGKNRPIPDYRDKVGFMPIKLPSVDGRAQYYAFEPKRMLYLMEDKESFRASASWQRIDRIMQTMVKLGEKEGFTVMFLYAPSAPHVVLPLVREQIPEEQLWRFALYQQKQLPPVHEFKQQVFDSLDNEQQVFLDACATHHLQCLSMTQALRDAAAQGKQVYFTYDQHWTPEGNRVVAEAIAQWFSQHRDVK